MAFWAPSLALSILAGRNFLNGEKWQNNPSVENFFVD
jgi:hypothetical protein